MTTKQLTKEKILEAGAGIVHRKGFNAAGIQEILTAADVPKGSFYFYFKNKQDFGIQLIEYFTIFFQEFTGPVLEDDTKSPVEKLRIMFGRFTEFFKEQDFKGGCPIGNLAQEMGDMDDTFRQKLESVICGMKEQYSTLLEQARQQGDIPESIDPKETADFIWSGWEGAILQGKVARNTASMEVFEKMVFDVLLKR